MEPIDPREAFDSYNPDSEYAGDDESDDFPTEHAEIDFEGEVDYTDPEEDLEPCYEEDDDPDGEEEAELIDMSCPHCGSTTYDRLIVREDRDDSVGYKAEVTYCDECDPAIDRSTI